MAKILIIDDSDGVRKKLAAILKASGFVVEEAIDGIEGLQQIESHKDLDLILCDVNMPRMDGITMVEEVAATLGPVAPIFMLTTETTLEAKTRGKEAGVRAWIIKPFQVEVLLAGIHKVLAEA